MAKPTRKDANLMVQILQWWAMIDLNESLNWMWSDAFIEDFDKFMEKYPPGTKEYGDASKILGAMESLGTLVKQDLLNFRLVDDWLAVGVIWGRIGGIALGVRKASGEPRMYENFEALAAKAS